VPRRVSPESATKFRIGGRKKVVHSGSSNIARQFNLQTNKYDVLIDKSDQLAMAFEPSLLEAFVKVAEERSFTRAAEALNSTQSTVSAQIQRLEVQAGHALFERSTRRVTLSRAGETLLGYARTILQLNEDAHASLAGSRFSGRLKIGVAEDLVDDWLPKILRSYARRHPALTLELEIGIVTQLLQKLETRDLDLAVGSNCNTKTAGWHLWQEPLVWAFADKRNLPDPLPLAFFPDPCPYRELALRALAKSGCAWQLAGSSPSLAGMRAIVRAGLAATPLPQGLIGSGLRVVDGERGLPSLPDVEYVAHLRNDDRREAVTTLAGLIRDAAGRS